MTYRPIAGVSRVYAFVGAARAGKDACAKILLRLIPGAERFALSDALSVYCRVQFGMRERDPKMLQNVGMLMRDLKPGVWLDALYGAIADRQPETAIITGVRFPDESDLVRDIGGTLIRVVRLEPDGSRYVSSDRDPSHRAETSIDGIRCDHEIVARSGDMASLERQLRALIAIPTSGTVVPRTGTAA